jgi:hypothetical protein
MIEREFFNKNAVEVDGIRFEIIIPEIVFVLPIRQAKPGNNTSVHLGLRITNNTSQPYCFSFYRHLIPEIIADGNNINGGHQSDLFLPAEQSDFHLTQPGKSVTFSQPARFSWQRKYNNRRKQDRNLVLSLPFTSCGFFIFQLINTGNYSIRFKYEVTNEEIKYYQNLMNEECFKAMWTGQVFTPYVDFCVVDTLS